VALKLDGGEKLQALEIAIGAMDTTPRHFPELTAGFVGKRLDATAISEIATQVMEHVRPYNNVPLSPTYRKRMVEVYVRRLLTRLAGS
jgi:CO/xanthine dehydrogenase FAD-binding subunit